MIAGRDPALVAREAFSTRSTDDVAAQLVRYVVVAGCGYLVALGSYAAALAVGIAPYEAVVVAFVLNGLFNFAGVRRWAFPASGRAATSELARFVAVAALSLVVNYSCFGLLYSIVGLPALLAQAIAIVVAAPVGFVANRLWSFSARR